MILNLNNGVIVLSDLPLKQRLEDQHYRKILALCIEEALGILKSSGFKPAEISKVKPKLVPTQLRLPNSIFNALAGSMFKINEDVRSSMWEDFVAGRTSEIDYLNGAVCQLGTDIDMPTPVNDKIVELVNSKSDGKTPHNSSAQELFEIIFRARHQPGDAKTE
ncbi:MAG: hypothetical protein GY761_11755 [Hyphomicrobiales bacterium]|nr:hypothetical protein [Hyphomicrobiales bacterium]